MPKSTLKRMLANETKTQETGNGNKVSEVNIFNEKNTNEICHRTYSGIEKPVTILSLVC